MTSIAIDVPEFNKVEAIVNGEILIPFNKLKKSPKNVRKASHNTMHVEALAASIKAKGLLQNLVVEPEMENGEPTGFYLVTIGEGRRLAYGLLVKQKHFKKTATIRCMLDTENDAVEISLDENVTRQAMHRADEFEAFLSLALAGKTPKEIADRFGASELIVNRRLALARVAPELFQLYRNDEITFEQLAAFTISDDHERQMEVWNSLPIHSRHVSTIKRMLSQDEVPASDKRLTFIGGIAAYEAAGGTVRRDLFSDEGEGGFATDSGLLDQIVLTKLNEMAEPFRSEGWKWVEVYAERPDDFYRLKRIYPTCTELSAEDNEQIEKLSEEYADLSELIESGVADEDAETRVDEIQHQIETIKDRYEAYHPNEMQNSGVLIFLDYYGKAEITCGVVKPDDEATTQNENDNPKSSDEDSAPEEEADDGITHSQSLIEDLTAQKTAALRVELAGNTEIALVAVVHSLLLGAFYRCAREHSALQIHLTHEGLDGFMKKPESSKAAIAFQGIRERVGETIPENPADLWEWCLTKSHEELLELLAFAAAHSVQAVETKFHGRAKAMAFANCLGTALSVDMHNWFEPTGEAYFTHINKKSIEAVITEAKGAEAATAIRAASKKSEAVTIAERLIKDTDWMPAPLRIA